MQYPIMLLQILQFPDKTREINIHEKLRVATLADLKILLLFLRRCI